MAFNTSGIHFSGDFTSSNPVIVLLHSSLSSSKQWWPLISLAKSEYRIINVDLMGYGDAQNVQADEDYDFSVEKERVMSALIEFNISAYHLVGHSFGGALALKLAVEHPEQVLSLSVYEPVAFHLFDKQSTQYQEAASFSLQVFENKPHKAAEIFTNFWNQPGFFVALPEKMQDLMATDMPKVNLDFFALMAEHYTLNDIGRIKAPVLLMSGQQSPKLAHNIISLLSEALENSRVLSFDAGHMAPVNKGEVVQTQIYHFIDQVEGQV